MQLLYFSIFSFNLTTWSFPRFSSRMTLFKKKKKTLNTIFQPRSQDLFPGLGVGRAPSQGKGPGNEVDDLRVIVNCRGGTQGWCSGESTRLPPMWRGCDSRSRCHVSLEFVVGSLLAPRFFSGYSAFPHSTKTNNAKFQLDPECTNTCIPFCSGQNGIAQSADIFQMTNHLVLKTLSR